MEEEAKKYNEELLIRLEKEIKELKMEAENKSVDRKKVLKKILLTLRLIAPYVFITTSTVEFFNIIGLGIPFVKGEIKRYLLTQTEIDTLGNTKICETYDTSKDYDNITFTYADKFKLNEDGTYSRNVTVYDAKMIDRKVLIDIINNKDFNIEGLFRKIISQKIETRDNVTCEELEEEFYMSYSYYNKDKNEYIYKEYSLEKNICIFTIELISMLVGYLVVINIRRGFFDYKIELDKIDERYCSNREYLKKLIRVKQDNYNFLVGNNDE